MAENGEQTGVEVLRAEAKKMTVGNPKLLGANDHVLINGEFIDTNKFTAGPEQHELRTAWLWFHDALVAHDNILDDKGYGLNDHKKHYKEEQDPQTGQMKRTYFQVDYWSWMIKIVDDRVIRHQLTLWGWSVENYMKHSVAMNASLSGSNYEESGGGGLWQWLTKKR